MARTGHNARAAEGDRASSSSSSDAEHVATDTRPSSSSTTLSTRGTPQNAAVEQQLDGVDAPATPKNAYTASEQRRQKSLFLADAEQFAFDFGGEATAIAETMVEDEAAQRAARRAEELEDATARAVAASAGHKSTAASTSPLSADEVAAFAAESLARGPGLFLALPKPGAQRKHASTSQEGALGEGTDLEGATFAEALPKFKAALRRYDEGLWRESKQHREEEEQKRAKARKRLRA